MLVILTQAQKGVVIILLMIYGTIFLYLLYKYFQYLPKRKRVVKARPMSKVYSVTRKGKLKRKVALDVTEKFYHS